MPVMRSSPPGQPRCSTASPRGYRPEIAARATVCWLCAPRAGFDAAEFRREREAAFKCVGKHSLEEVRAGSQRRAREPPETQSLGFSSRQNALISTISRLFRVACLSLLATSPRPQAAWKAPKALQASAHEISATMACLKERD